ncbi:MAG: M81 family metallopeptidase [Geminicoccaceae bacterium]
MDKKGMVMARIAIAGFQHETNTFGATRADFCDFEEADSWPGLLISEEVISGTAGINLPSAGFVEAARSDPEVELVPILWCAAEPCSYVTKDAFERIAMMILDGIRRAGQLDGIYLDLHGAMVTERFEDGEGELLSRVRSLVGNDLPITVSLDLHANVTPRMTRHATSIAIFRTYPHLDMAETGKRAYQLLQRHLRNEPVFKAFRQAPFLIPLQAQHTGARPCQDLYDMLDDIARHPVISTDIAMGFSAADIHDLGPSVVSYATDQSSADRVADALIDAITAAEASFDCDLMSSTEAVRAAMPLEAPGPVVIADVQDNPGAGGTSDSTGMLTSLVEQSAEGAMLGLLNDPEIAALAHRHGVGACFEAELGGKSGLPGQVPFKGNFQVEALSNGRFAFTGEMYRGAIAEVGPTAVLKVLAHGTEIQVVVGSKRCQCLDQAIFTHIGLDPRRARIIVVKSTVHFRADFGSLASAVLVAEAPGAFPCRLDKVPYQRLRAGIRTGPRLAE